MFELLPNMLPFIVLGLVLSIMGSIAGLVGMTILGLGPSGVIDLGLLLENAVGNGALGIGAAHVFMAPVAFLTVLFVALNFINIGLDDAYNPRLQKMAGS
ncbi:MAG: ABC transporter permease subunit [Micromonosporaceae bacterium]|nr:ABC transporter permease subunit [Micromonosporaceae bacterium]